MILPILAFKFFFVNASLGRSQWTPIDSLLTSLKWKALCWCCRVVWVIFTSSWVPWHLFWITDLFYVIWKVRAIFKWITYKLQGFLNHQTKQQQRKKNKRGVASELKSSCPKAWLFQDVHCVTADTKYQHCVFLPQVTPKPGRTSLFPGIQTILLEQTVSQS